MSNDWSNKEGLNIRTKLALRVLMLMFRIIAPYQFGREYEKEITALTKIMDEA